MFGGKVPWPPETGSSWSSDRLSARTWHGPGVRRMAESGDLNLPVAHLACQRGRPELHPGTYPVQVRSSVAKLPSSFASGPRGSSGGQSKIQSWMLASTPSRSSRT
jgi:hypothetical protein